VTIGPSVKIGTGATILAPAKIGAAARIGANAVVVGDVPAHATAVGIPARIVAG
jgi:serine O-acetyltransferase